MASHSAEFCMNNDLQKVQSRGVILSKNAVALQFHFTGEKKGVKKFEKHPNKGGLGKPNEYKCTVEGAVR